MFALAWKHFSDQIRSCESSFTLLCYAMPVCAVVSFTHTHALKDKIFHSKSCCGTKRKHWKTFLTMQLLTSLYAHQNRDEFGFNSALHHKAVEDSHCCLCCLAPSGSRPISLHQTRQTESEKWRSPAWANINPKFPASIPSWPWFGMTSICWLAAHISLQIVWARLICFYARLVKNVMPR